MRTGLLPGEPKGLACPLPIAGGLPDPMALLGVPKTLVCAGCTAACSVLQGALPTAAVNCLLLTPATRPVPSWPCPFITVRMLLTYNDELDDDKTNSSTDRGLQRCTQTCAHAAAAADLQQQSSMECAHIQQGSQKTTRRSFIINTFDINEVNALHALKHERCRVLQACCVSALWPRRQPWKVLEALTDALTKFQVYITSVERANGVVRLAALGEQIRSVLHHAQMEHVNEKATALK